MCFSEELQDISGDEGHWSDSSVFLLEIEDSPLNAELHTKGSKSLIRNEVYNENRISQDRNYPSPEVSTIPGHKSLDINLNCVKDEELNITTHIVPFKRKVAEASISRNSSEMLIDIYCYKCGEVCSKPSELIKHFTDEHPNCKPFVCIICNKDFENHHRWKSHQLIHAEIKQLNCNVCDNTYSSKWQYWNHKPCRAEVDQAKPYFCKICDQNFKRLSDLQYHFTKYHQLCTTKPYSCKYCNKSYYLEKSYKRHKLMHNEPSPIENTSDNNTAKTDNTKKKFNCNLCKKTFTNRVRLQSHKKLHRYRKG